MKKRKSNNIASLNINTRQKLCRTQDREYVTGFTTGQTIKGTKDGYVSWDSLRGKEFILGFTTGQEM